MNGSVVVAKRCAVYCRVSSDERLDQSFNSIDAQREAGLAFIASQAHEGWTALPDTYEDPGFSGGNMARPGLRRLLADIEAARVDIVVVYKIDRLSRSLADFAKMVEIFDRSGASFSSVTQQINSATSMGRLMLNVLLSFAQFEREVTAERIRDKIAASKRKGLWMGGHVPYGYAVKDRKLEIVPTEAKVLVSIFERFVQLRSITEVCRCLAEEGVMTRPRKLRNGVRAGTPMDKRFISDVLRHPVYVGDLTHKGETHRGEHQAIVGRDLWDAVQAILAECPSERGARTKTLRSSGTLLGGLVFGPDGERYGTTFSQKKNGKRYWYYIAKTDKRYGYGTSTFGTLPAAQLDAIVVHQVIGVLQSPEATEAVWARVQQLEPRIAEPTVVLAMRNLAEVWKQLFAEEQRRILHLLIERVSVEKDGIDIHWRESGWIALAGELAPATIGGELLEMEDA